MKITIIGGGSFSWTHGLVQNFILNPFFDRASICLMDIAAEALAEVHQVCCAFNGKPNHLDFTTTTDLRRALDGADHVIVAISHGGLEPELEDHRLARRHGRYNLKGSEVGIAGASRTLRHVPEVVRIARLMERHCPQARLLNVTNPLTAITRSVNRYTSIPSTGFCHGVANHLAVLFPLFGATGWEGIDFTVAGVDHSSFLLAVRHHGKDALAIMRDKGLIEAARRGDAVASHDDPFAGTENQRLRFLLWDILGYLPAISDEHCVEFFGQMMGSDELRRYYGITYDRIAERQATVAKARAASAARKLGTDPAPRRCSEIIDRFIAALHGGGQLLDVLNHPNQGQIANLPAGSVVETHCLVNATGVHPVISGPLPPILESIVRPIIIREELYMEAAMEDSAEKLQAALAMDPLVNDFRGIRQIAEEMLAYNRGFLDPDR